MPKPITIAVSTSACGKGSACFRRQRGGERVAGDRRLADRKAPHREDEEVHRVGQQRQPEHHVEGAGAQRQVDARCGEQSDAKSDQEFHASIPQRGCACGAPPACRRAMLVSETMTEPTTVRNTPRSKNIALAIGTSPITGRIGCTKLLVRKG